MVCDINLVRETGKVTPGVCRKSELQGRLMLEAQLVYQTTSEGVQGWVRGGSRILKRGGWRKLLTSEMLIVISQ